MSEENEKIETGEKKEAVPDKLSASTSPTAMEIKKAKARRLNSKPMMIGSAIGVFVILIFTVVMISRGNRARAEVAKGAQAGRTAVPPIAGPSEAAGGEGGIINPSPPPAEPQTPPKEKPDAKNATPPPSVVVVPAPRVPDPLPQLSEEAKKMRDRRMRQFEQAIDAPIQVRIDESKLEASGIDGEMARLERQLATLSNQNTQTYEQRLAAIQAAVNGEPDGTDYNTRGDLSRTRQFAGGGDWTNPSAVDAPATKHIIRTGSVIPATLISGINSDLPGQIIGQVSQDVYDTPTGKHILIPQGSRLVGEYSSQVQYGQSRVFVVWQRIIFPDGKALDLGEMPGSSGAGYAGFRDQVNNHYIRTFASAIMMSAILAGVEMTQEQQDTEEGSNQQRMSDALSEALGNQLGGVMAEMLQKNMNIAPTLEIRPGYRFNIMLVKDLEFKSPYRGFDY
ncbi:MAG: conjugal transfer protein TrbI [Planctomycetota bacterium]|jgi:type IV secretion system protein VirB10|nr:conjugal transfer protein TrbI [Planctomycetota bacterium]